MIIPFQRAGRSVRSTNEPNVKCWASGFPAIFHYCNEVYPSSAAGLKMAQNSKGCCNLNNILHGSCVIMQSINSKFK